MTTEKDKMLKEIEKELKEEIMNIKKELDEIKPEDNQQYQKIALQVLLLDRIYEEITRIIARHRREE